MKRDEKGRFLKGLVSPRKGKSLEGFHKCNCDCSVCRVKRGELKGETHPGYGKRLSNNNRKAINDTSKMGSKKGERAGEKNYNWKGGKPKCIDCGKKLSSYGYKRCKDCCRKGELNGSWKGGISNNPYPKEFNTKLKLKIRTRDRFTCLICGKTEREELEELNRVLCVNHIDFNKNNCKESNLNTLCLRCNIKINREREYWVDFFNQSI